MIIANALQLLAIAALIVAAFGLLAEGLDMWNDRKAPRYALFGVAWFALCIALARILWLDLGGM